MVMENKDDFREQAARCRRLADSMTSAADYLQLHGMADELERKAEQCDAQVIPIHLTIPTPR